MLENNLKQYNRYFSNLEKIREQIMGFGVTEYFKKLSKSESSDLITLIFHVEEDSGLLKTVVYRSGTKYENGNDIKTMFSTSGLEIHARSSKIRGVDIKIVAQKKGFFFKIYGDIFSGSEKNLNYSEHNLKFNLHHDFKEKEKWVDSLYKVFCPQRGFGNYFFIEKEYENIENAEKFSSEKKLQENILKALYLARENPLFLKETDSVIVKDGLLKLLDFNVQSVEEVKNSLISSTNKKHQERNFKEFKFLKQEYFVNIFKYFEENEIRTKTKKGFVTEKKYFLTYAANELFKQLPISNKNKQKIKEEFIKNVTIIKENKCLISFQEMNIKKPKIRKRRK